MTFSWLGLAVGIPLGLLLPGFLLARLLRAGQPLACGFAVSLVVLFQVCFWLGVAGVPLGFGVVSVVLLGLCLHLWAWERWGRAAAVPAPTGWLAWPRGRSWGFWLAVAAGVAWLAVVGWRFWMRPNTGPEAYFRYDGLARLLFERREFSFYPPFRAADFRLYGWIDSVPPEVSFANCWLYLCAGRVWGAWTMVLGMGQMLALGAFIWGLARQLFSRQAAWLALALAGSSPMLFWTLGIGQETGLIALGLMGTLYLLVSAPAESRTGHAVLAGLATAVAALAREYGGFVLICGLFCAWWRGYGWRRCALYAGTAAFCFAPWYLRTWYLTGNPVWSIGVGSLFPVNPVYALMAQDSSRHLAFGSRIGYNIVYFALAFLRYAALPVGLGLLGAWRYRARHPDLWGSALLCVLVWLLAMPMMAIASYSERVLAPALSVASVLAAGWLAEEWQGLRRWLLPGLLLCLVSLALLPLLDRGWVSPHRWPWLLALAAAVPVLAVWLGRRLPRPWLGRLAALLLVLAVGRGALFAVVFPWRSLSPPPQGWRGYLGLSVVRPFPETAIRNYLAAGAPGMRLLSDSHYMHCYFRGSGVELVMLWSPEVAFAFDPRLTPAEVTARLRQLGIAGIFMGDRTAGVWPLLAARHPFFAARQGWNKSAAGAYWDLYLFPGIALPGTPPGDGY